MAWPPSSPIAGVPVLPGNTGVPLELRGEFPWLLLIGIGAGLSATVLGFSSRRRRRRTA
jgi:LPXTG-motif cell wall-anchored protein